MSLVPCRACGHQVDTSALACPGCGATDPGKKLSRQQSDWIKFAVQALIWFFILVFGGLYVSKTLIPMARTFLNKPPITESHEARN